MHVLKLIPCLQLILLYLTRNCDGLAIDNGVLGVPQVSCSENSVTFSVRTENIFRGNIYIKNKYVTPECRQEYFSNSFNGASFTVTIGGCGMQRIRSLQPNGMNYILVFVVNFHPQFVTKIDRAYNVKCFYQQQDKQVTSQLEVSMLTTQTIEDTTSLSPNCEYSVRANSLNGPRVRFVRVGDMLFHRWECDNPNYGMLVKNCFVNDGVGSSVRVLDNRGCPVFSPVIQGPLQYDNSLNLAYVEIWAYKFPDRSSLFFQCQIQICNKRENGCLGITPPNCPRVLKSEFEPASAVDTSVDPNRVNVRGNFDRFNPAPAGGVSGFGSQQPVVPAGTNQVNAAPNIAPGSYGNYPRGAVKTQSAQLNQFPKPVNRPSYGSSNQVDGGVNQGSSNQYSGYGSAGGGFNQGAQGGAPGYGPQGGFNQGGNQVGYGGYNQPSSDLNQANNQGYNRYQARLDSRQRQSFQNKQDQPQSQPIRTPDERSINKRRPMVGSSSNSDNADAQPAAAAAANTASTAATVKTTSRQNEGGSAEKEGGRLRDIPLEWSDEGWDTPVRSVDMHKLQRLGQDYKLPLSSFDSQDLQLRYRRESFDLILENQRRAALEEEKNTMDILSENIFIADVEDDPPEDGEKFTHFPFTSAEVDDDVTICLNPVATGLTISCFCFMLILLLALLFYVLTRNSSASKSMAKTGSKLSSFSTSDRAPLTTTSVRRLWKQMSNVARCEMMTNDDASDISIATCRSQSDDGKYEDKVKVKVFSKDHLSKLDIGPPKIIHQHQAC